MYTHVSRPSHGLSYDSGRLCWVNNVEVLAVSRVEGATDIRIGKMLAHLWGSAGIFPASKIERMLSILWRAWPSHVVQAQSDAMVFVSSG
jgi:hypothetical protein